MSGIIDEEIHYNMLKRLSLQQQFKAVQELNDEGSDTNQASSIPPAGKIAGRSVTQLATTDSKEAKIASKLFN